MKYAIFIFAIAFVVSCSRKQIPAATAPIPEVVKTEEGIKTGVIAAAETEMSIAGHAIYDAKCGRCHQLEKPGDFTAEQWVPILKRMAPKAKLDSTETANVMAYVSFYAKPA